MIYHVYDAYVLFYRRVLWQYKSFIENHKRIQFFHMYADLNKRVCKLYPRKLYKIAFEALSWLIIKRYL